MDITKHKFYDNEVEYVYILDEYDQEHQVVIELSEDLLCLTKKDVKALAIHFGLLPESAGKG